MRILLFLLSIILFIRCTTDTKIIDATSKIKLLVLSGRNNHEWQKTTPQLVKMYEESGVFETAVTENPDTLTYEDFQLFNVVVSNWSAWPEHEYRWTRSTEDGLLKFMEEGGGFVLFHAASATFYSWKEYQNMVGTTWGDSTKHGKVLPHKIVIKDRSHPITKGMSDFWITDELWVNAGINSDLNVLAASNSAPENSGRGETEPVIHWNKMGAGRIFHNILGHNTRAMKNSGWKALMLRGTEWAATGEVSIPIPASLSGEKPEKTMNYSWEKTDSTIALLNGEHILWKYNFNTGKGKPFFHPINIHNSTITWLSPDDHPWHLGIWHSWKFINGVNYWEYDRRNGVAPFNFLGVTEVKKVSINREVNYSCTIEQNIAYHEKNGPDLLLENRTVTVSAPDDNGLFTIDYEFYLSARADTVELNRTPLPHEKNGKDHGGYAGLSVRFSQDFFEPDFINSDGSTKINHGKPYAWRYYGLRDIQGKKVGAAIFTGTENLSYPEPWFVTNYEDHPFYYFSPAPIFNQPHVLQKSEKLKLHYRMQFYAGEVDYVQLKGDYKRYLEKENNL